MKLQNQKLRIAKSKVEQEKCWKLELDRLDTVHVQDHSLRRMFGFAPKYQFCICLTLFKQPSTHPSPPLPFEHLVDNLGRYEEIC